MTDLIQALSTALDRLAKVEAILERLENIEHRLDLHSGILAGFENRLDRDQVSINVLEKDMRALETGDNLDSQIETVVERVLDRVLEDALDSALSGREITVTL
jgi:tRNA(Ile)-lysidine synthase TilS/MesJ